MQSTAARVSALVTVVSSRVRAAAADERHVRRLMVDPSDSTLSDQLRDLPIGLRIYIIVLLTLSAVGASYAALFLLTQSEHWIATAVAFLIVEPVAVASALALITVAAPDSIAAELLLGAVRRASLSAALVGIAYVGSVIWMLIWIGFEWVRR